MPLCTIDWPNITATLAASIIGGLIAAYVARGQIRAAMQVERDKARRETALELLESMDSYVHIAYRGEDAQQHWERQRLRRRIISLTVLTLPEQLTPVGCMRKLKAVRPMQFRTLLVSFLVSFFFK